MLIDSEYLTGYYTPQGYHKIIQNCFLSKETDIVRICDQIQFSCSDSCT